MGEGAYEYPEGYHQRLGRMPHAWTRNDVSYVDSPIGETGEKKHTLERMNVVVMICLRDNISNQPLENETKTWLCWVTVLGFLQVREMAK